RDQHPDRLSSSPPLSRKPGHNIEPPAGQRHRETGGPAPIVGPVPRAPTPGPGRGLGKQVAGGRSIVNNALEFLIHHSSAVLFAAVLANQLGVPVPATPFLIAVGALARTGEASPAVAIALPLAP